MKIVHLCLSCFYIDNYSYQENMLPKYHVKMGHEVTVIASPFSFNDKGKGCYLEVPSERFDKDGYKVIRLAYKQPIKINRVLRKYDHFYQTLSNEKPDLIFTHGISMSEISSIIKYLKVNPHVKLYGDNHADYINSATTFASKHILHKIIWRHYAKKLEPFLIKCYGVTPMRCRFLTEMYHLNPNLVEFLPMGVDDEDIPMDRGAVRQQIKDELGIPDEAFLIMTGGKIDERKNIHVLIEAVQQINNPKLHVVICGVLTPQMEHLKEKFNDNIHYLGWCDSSRVMNCMVAADLACFPGTHSTLWEQAVGVGLPAIFKRWNEMTHMNVNNNCVFIKGEDVKELRHSIEKMLCEEYYKAIKSKSIQAATSFLYSDIAKKAIECK